MDLSQEKSGNVTVVEVHDDHLDASNAEEFRNEMQSIVESSSKVVLDLSEIHFVDSTGLGAILSALRRLTSTGGDLKLAGASRQVRAVFELSRMHRILDILETPEEAVRSFGE